MLIRNIKEFLKLTMNKRIISLDIGKSKIGSAISDQNHLIVTPLNVFPKKISLNYLKPSKSLM